MSYEIVFQVLTKTGIVGMTVSRENYPEYPQPYDAYRCMGKWGAGSGAGGVKTWTELKKSILSDLSRRKGCSVVVESDFWKSIP